MTLMEVSDGSFLTCYAAQRRTTVHTLVAERDVSERHISLSQHISSGFGDQPIRVTYLASEHIVEFF